MTNQQLIDKLRQYPMDMEVLIYSWVSHNDRLDELSPCRCKITLIETSTNIATDEREINLNCEETL